MSTNVKQHERNEVIDALHNYIKRGDTVYTVLRHRSASGMSRLIDLYCIRDNKPQRITYLAAKALGWRYDINKEALRVTGCGMDMGFHTVYALSSALFRADGFKDVETGEDAGYSLKHEWM